MQIRKITSIIIKVTREHEYQVRTCKGSEPELNRTSAVRPIKANKDRKRLNTSAFL